VTFSLSAPAGDLASAARHAASVISNRTIVPIYGHLQFTLRNGVAHIRGTGPDSQAVAEIEADGEGTFTLPGSQFVAAVSGLPSDAAVNINPKGESARLASGYFNQVFTTLPPEEFPDFVHKADGATVELYADQILAELPVLAGAAMRPAEKTGRKYLEGIYFDFKKGAIAATNTHVLYRADAPWAALEEGEAVPSFILPYEAVAPLKEILGGAEMAQLNFFGGGKVVEFVRGTKRFSTKVVEADYPEYERMIPAVRKNHIKFSVAEMLTALKRVSNVPTEDNFRAVRMTINENGVRLAARDGRGGEAEDVCSAEIVQGGSCQFAIAIEYLSWALRSFGKVADVVFQLEDGKSAGIMRAAEQGDSKAVRVLGPRAW
jgi:DNA polymerase-3 subunit beta